MSDLPFQRPGSEPRTSNPSSASSEAASHLVLTNVPPDGIASRSPRRPNRKRGHVAAGLVVAGVVGVLLGGLGVAALTAAPPSPEPVALSADSFPRMIFGEPRTDLELRDAASGAVLQRLDAQFEAQLDAYRFAYGGDGADFDYGDLQLKLTIVNGRLAPAVPVAGDGTDSDIVTAVSLQSGMTSCVSQLPLLDKDVRAGSIFIDPETGETVLSLLPEPGETIMVLTNEFMWNDCVLVDAERNLSLRLAGQLQIWKGEDPTAANQFKDELERIHEELVG